jgi:HemY protein
VALEAMWRSVPEAERQSPEIALEAARLFNGSDAELGRFAVEAIEAALQQSPAAWDDSSLSLLDEYARAHASPRDQLERVEAWLKAAPPSGPIRTGLLRAAGLICLRQQLWGKSKAYLLESMAADRDASTLFALARLAEAIGDEREAASYFKEAAVAFAKGSTSVSDSPAAVWRTVQR